jgi:hypothetical protein
MRLHERSLSKVSLTDILRRRKKSLREFLLENGIVTYETLTTRCSSMGVLPPSIASFNEAAGKTSEAQFMASSPTEGVVVLDPPTLVMENTGRLQPIEDLEAPGIDVECITSQDPKKKKKGK